MTGLPAGPHGGHAYQSRAGYGGGGAQVQATVRPVVWQLAQFSSRSVAPRLRTTPWRRQRRGAGDLLGVGVLVACGVPSATT